MTTHHCGSDSPGNQLLPLSQVCYREVLLYATDADRIVPRDVLSAAYHQSAAGLGNISAWLETEFCSKGKCAAYPGHQYAYAPLPDAAGEGAQAEGGAGEDVAMGSRKLRLARRLMGAQH